ncbi:MAG TPA: fibrobacter succinogenes major paralogous domain-containing protein [Bacteroidia bacterium]|jgi:uncharacterized protein (TIGR02145 family)|nr:fibrobacter succinogenes major paralogous domain-containing protein [Bacteroidia bacterium]
MKPLLILILSLSFSLAAFGQAVKNSDEVKIGKQVWMVKNLNVSSFKNGEIIPEAKTEAEWKKATIAQKPAWCYYNDDSNNGSKYGKLYNWYAVNDKRGLAPQGWHIASDSEYSALITYLSGGSKKKDIAPSIKSKAGWEDNGQGTNSSGFTALPGGACNGDGDFGDLGNTAYFWTSTEDQNHTAALFYSVASDDATVWQVINFKSRGFSVRCIKDSL